MQCNQQRRSASASVQTQAMVKAGSQGRLTEPIAIKDEAILYGCCGFRVVNHTMPLNRVGLI